MKRSLRSFGFIIVIFLFALGMVALLISQLDSVEGGLSSSITQDEFEVDNSDGLMPGKFEPELTVTNDGDSSVNVTITMTEPRGEDWGGTKNVYPHIFSDKSRRKDQGHKYYVELAEGDNKFYPMIDVNASAFADTYLFKITVQSKQGDFAPDIDMTVVVTPFNSIPIELSSNDEKEKSVTAGKTTVISVRLMNRGNIFNEEVTVEVFGEDKSKLPLNLTLLEIQFPGDRNWVNPEDFSSDIDIYIDVLIEVDSESGPGKFEIEIYAATPENDDPRDGHQYATSEIEVKIAGTDKPPDQELDEGGDFPIAIFGGGLAAIIVVMGGAFYFLVLNKEEEDEGWGEGEGWGAGEWGEDESYDMGGAAEEYEAPITASPRPRPAQGGPRPRPMAGPAPAPRSAGPRPAGPAHVKCPKCHTGVKVSNPKRPLTIGCPRCSTKFTLKGKPGAAPAPRPAGPRPAGPKPAGPAHVKCPKCHTGVKISNPKRPLTIGCPKCSTKFTLKGAPGGAPAPAPRPAGPKPAGPAHVKCPKCHTGVKVSNPKRPLTIGCPTCSTKFTLKGAPGGAPAPGPRPGGAAAKGPALISCPKCSTKFKVTNPKRPLKVACPKCKTGLNLK